MQKISVIIPCRNEEKYIAGCLESVIRSDYPKDFLEVFIVDGLSNDATVNIVNNYIKKFNFIYLLTNENKTPPHALNLAIKESTGDYIIRLDAHGEIPKNYFSELVIWSKRLCADNVGARWNTEVKNKTRKTIAIKKVLSNKFGVGNSLFRTGIKEVTEVDTVPFGCFRKEVFEKIGLFDVRLTRDQDIELNKRIKRAQGKIYLLPELFSTYYARETFTAIAKNHFQTGMWNLLTVYYTKRFDSLSLRHFVPLIFLLSLLIPLLLMVWIPAAGIATAASFISYTITISIVSLKLCDGSTSFLYLLFAFFVIHFSYGFGSLSGLLKINTFFK